ncbi:MAG TPA: ATP-binding protein [Terriglobales bacterium]|nr:ATP-binding protein [Terriglobales bacterium]
MNTPIHALVIFRKLLDDEVVRQAVCLSEGGGYDVVDTYADFAAALFEHTENWSRYLLSRVLEDESLYLMKIARGEAVSGMLADCLAAELTTLRAFSMLSPKDIPLPAEVRLPQWQTEDIDFAGIYAAHLAEIPHRGYGVFARHRAFRMADGRLVPVLYPDSVRLTDLVGYRRQRELVLENTRALLRGAPAANVLLYGDSGTGKSSTVKAVLNELAPEGLRLVELRKEQLHDIPALLDRLSGNPLKFILYIDDLSFTKDDDNFRALKAVLEGSIASRRQNVAVYATSNRRHLVQETFSDRDGDEIHLGDTLEEQSSLADRFGLSVTFARPDKDEFLEIAAALAAKSGLSVSPEELAAGAQAFALRRGGRSPRVARQYVEHLVTARLENEEKER